MIKLFSPLEQFDIFLTFISNYICITFDILFKFKHFILFLVDKVEQLSFDNLIQYMHYFYIEYYYYIYFLFLIFLSIAYYFRVGVIYELIQRIFNLLKKIKIIKGFIFCSFICFISYNISYIIIFYVFFFFLSTCIFFYYFFKVFFGSLLIFDIGDIIKSFTWKIAPIVEKIQLLNRSCEDFLDTRGWSDDLLELQDFWILFCEVVTILIFLPCVFSWYVWYSVLKVASKKKIKIVSICSVFINLLIRIIIGLPIWFLKILIRFFEVLIMPQIDCVFKQSFIEFISWYDCSLSFLLSNSRIYMNKGVLIFNPNHPFEAPAEMAIGFMRGGASVNKGHAFVSLQRLGLRVEYSHLKFLFKQDKYGNLLKDKGGNFILEKNPILPSFLLNKNFTLTHSDIHYLSNKDFVGADLPQCGIIHTLPCVFKDGNMPFAMKNAIKDYTVLVFIPYYCNLALSEKPILGFTNNFNSKVVCGSDLSQDELKNIQDLATQGKDVNYIFKFLEKYDSVYGSFGVDLNSKNFKDL